MDIAKGIGIILMIIGHCSIQNKYIDNFIYCFHMPLFFIISGYFFKAKDNKSCIINILKKYIVPYILTSIIIILYKVFRLLLDNNFEEILHTTKIWGIASIYGSGSLKPFGMEVSIGAIWFLLALSFATYFMNYTSNSKYQLIWILIIAYIGYKTSKYIWLPFSIQAGMVATIFMYIGVLAKKYDIFNKKLPKIVMLSSILLLLFCTIYGEKLYMVSNVYPKGLLDIIGACCGTLLCIKLSVIIEKFTKIIKKLLIFIGKNSLICLCLHIISLDCLHYIKIKNILINNFGITSVSIRNIIVNFLWVFVMLILVKLVLNLFNKYYVAKKSI